jgi:hypothetical protein
LAGVADVIIVSYARPALRDWPRRMECVMTHEEDASGLTALASGGLIDLRRPTRRRTRQETTRDRWP